MHTIQAVRKRTGVQFAACGTIAQSCLKGIENVTVVLRFEFLGFVHVPGTGSGALQFDQYLVT